MLTYRDALLALIDIYAAEADAHGGRSLSRIATLIVNRGSFFAALRAGANCSIANLEKCTSWFRRPDNWPRGIVPEQADRLLAGMGRPAVRA